MKIILFITATVVLSTALWLLGPRHVEMPEGIYLINLESKKILADPKGTHYDPWGMPVKVRRVNSHKGKVDAIVSAGEDATWETKDDLQIIPF